MSDLTYTISMPFKIKGKDGLKESEIVLALSIDLNWFPPEQAKSILKDAEKAGLLKRDGELIRPSFDLNSVQIPTGFKPQSGAEKESIFDRTVERIISGNGMEKRKVIALVNKKQEELSKLVEIDVSAILVAMELGVPVDDLIDEEFASLINPLSYS
jgi:hypothetical protein